MHAVRTLPGSERGRRNWELHQSVCLLNQTFLKKDISQLSPNVTTYQTLTARNLINVPICQNK